MDFARTALIRRLRPHQKLALDSVSVRSEPTGGGISTADRGYLVLPPGAGKTLIGLEAARRIGRRTLVLAPNTAVQGQWAASWRRDFRPETRCGIDRSLREPLTVLTYQSLAVLENGAAERRHRIIRSGTRDELLGLLHPNGRDLVERAAALAPWTLVLDECHHLLQTWGALVRAVIDELGPQTTVIGLTATPPRQLTAWQRALHDDLFGEDADFEVPAAALVKDGELAPYQELVYLTAPTVEEDTWLADQQSRFAQLQIELVDRRLGTIPLLEWLNRRIVRREHATGAGNAVERRTENGATASWREFETAEPDLARAGLRFAAAGMIPIPEDIGLREEHRAAVGATDWVAVLTDFCLGHLQESADPADQAALQAIRRVLPSLGYRLTRAGVRTTTSPVDRVCGLSAAKVAAAVHVLATEDAVLADDLRALVLCDFETQTGELPSTLRDTPLTGQSGSARLAFESFAAADVSGPGGLRPMLVTGRNLVCPARDADRFLDFCRHAGWTVRAEPAGTHVRVAGDSTWSPRVWARLATEYFAAGNAHVLVGTRALLGEGWDCPAVNVTVDLTTAATATAVTQMRGRSMRLDPQAPDKVADNWTITCVTADHPRGDADYFRLVRKHNAYLATADGVIESGVGHCDAALSPYEPPDDLGAITARALARVEERGTARKQWRIGEPYVGNTTSTIRVRVRRTLGDTSAVLPRAIRRPAPGHRPHGHRRWAALTGLVGAGAGVLVDVAATAPAGIAVGLATAAAGIGVPTLRQSRRLNGASGALEQLARAVADGLCEAGGTSAGAANVVLQSTPDGWLRCELAGVSEAESGLFTASLEELLAPLAQPRQLVGRVVIDVPTTRRGRLAMAARATLGLPITAAIGWHAVPAWSAAGSRRLRIFLDAWERHVGPPRQLAADSPEGQGILDLFRGADPFAVTTQLRTVWR
jgi:superfamily II DNA or RNA helicase